MLPHPGHHWKGVGTGGFWGHQEVSAPGAWRVWRSVKGKSHLGTSRDLRGDIGGGFCSWRHRDRREGGEGEGKGGSHSLRYGLGGHLPLVGQLVLEAFHLFFPLWEIPLVHGALRGLRWAGNRDFGALSCPDPSSLHPKGSPRMGTAWPRLWGRFPTPQWSSQRLQELLELFWLR